MSAKQLCQRRLDARDDDEAELGKFESKTAVSAARTGRAADEDEEAEEEHLEHVVQGAGRFQRHLQHAYPHEPASAVAVDFDTFKADIQSSQRFMLPRQSVVIGGARQTNFSIFLISILR